MVIDKAVCTFSDRRSTVFGVAYFAVLKSHVSAPARKVFTGLEKDRHSALHLGRVTGVRHAVRMRFPHRGRGDVSG